VCRAHGLVDLRRLHGPLGDPRRVEGVQGLRGVLRLGDDLAKANNRQALGLLQRRHVAALAAGLARAPRGLGATAFTASLAAFAARNRTLLEGMTQHRCYEPQSKRAA
jgi:hypothetical protein